MGTVYLGESADGQQVAIKVINPEYSQHEQFRMRFRREADAAQTGAPVLHGRGDRGRARRRPALRRHRVRDRGPTWRRPYGESGPLRGSSLDALAVGVATALTAIHGAGVVHRDLKPSNVLLSPVGPRVIDFGIARALDTLGGVTGTGELIGTPRYMAPEVLRGEPVSPACDVFSWGCLVAFAASGRPPFGGEALPAVLYQVLNTEPVLDGRWSRGCGSWSLRRCQGSRPRGRPRSSCSTTSVGRSAAPEQTAQTVQAAWQRSPSLQNPAPQRPSVQSPSTQRPAAQTAPAAHETVPWAEPPARRGGSLPGPDRTAPASPRAGRPAGQQEDPHRGRRGGPDRGGRRAGPVSRALPGRSSRSLALLYQDDFTQSGTGWTGGTYDPGSRRTGTATPPRVLRP